MPFVQRQVEPKFIARRSAASKEKYTQSTLQDNELESITNLTLSNAIRQLASLLVLSKEIFTELNEGLEKIGDRSVKMKERITVLHKKVEDPSYDAKLVVVREYLSLLILNILKTRLPSHL